MQENTSLGGVIAAIIARYSIQNDIHICFPNYFTLISEYAENIERDIQEWSLSEILTVIFALNDDFISNLQGWSSIFELSLPWISNQQLRPGFDKNL